MKSECARRDQKNENATFDMARSLFGPGGALDYDEDEDLSSGTASEHPVEAVPSSQPEETSDL